MENFILKVVMVIGLRLEELNVVGDEYTKPGVVIKECGISRE
jgi:hypothetical protein